MKKWAEAQPLAELDLFADLGVRRLPGEHHLVHGPALGRAAADHALDAVLGHELQRARRAALDRLPALHRQVEGPRNQGELLQGVAAIGDLGRQRVVLALVREGVLVEGLEDDLGLLLVELAVGLLVAQRRAERLDLARVVAASDAEDYASACQDVGHRVVLGEPQRMPHRHDVEAASDLQVLGDAAQMHRHHQEVGDALGAFALEMMLGHPEAVVAEAVHQLGHVLGLAQRGGQMPVVVAPLVDRRAAIADVVEVGMAGKQAVKLGDHGVFPD
jgi:hypothetical protein